MERVGEASVVMVGTSARTIVAVGPADVPRFEATGWRRLEALSLDELRTALVDAYEYIDAFERGDLDDG